jgi:rhomboid-like protein
MWNRLRSSLLVSIIIALNVVVYFLWQPSDESRLLFMADNFTVSWNAVMEGHFWTLFTSVFSHNAGWHLFINMFVLLSFGSILEQILGRSQFIKLYLFAGIVGSIGHCVVSKYLMDDPEIAAVGASGAICGLVLVFALLFPKAKILVFGIIPVPALLGAIGLAGLDVWGVFAQTQGGGLPIGHGAHLGGALAGLFYYFAWIRPRKLTGPGGYSLTAA